MGPPLISSPGESTSAPGDPNVDACLCLNCFSLNHICCFFCFFFLSASDPLLFTSLSLKCLVVLLLTHAAALSASLWLGIPVVVTNPRFLVAKSLGAPGVLSSCALLPPLTSFYATLLFLCFNPPVSCPPSLRSLWRLTSARAPHHSGFSVMASNSIFDSFSNYSSSLLRGKCWSCPLHSALLTLWPLFSMCSAVSWTKKALTVPQWNVRVASCSVWMHLSVCHVCCEIGS